MLSKKILIVDDEPEMLDILGARLKTFGFEICTAREGSEAVEKVKDEKPDLIIMDVLMPHMSGFEAMKQIRKDPESRAIPAIVISSYAGVKDYFSDMPGIEFIQKSCESKELMEKIKVMLGQTEGHL